VQLLLFLALSLFSRANDAVNEVCWRVWLEAKSAHAPVVQELTGAQRTVLCAGFLTDDGLRPAAKGEIGPLGVDEETFFRKARANAQADLAGLKPRYVRNRKKVIEYAELKSDKPLVSGAVLAPGFLALFKDTLGPKVLVVVPNRFTAYVFPALATTYEDYGPMVLEAVQASAWPVSAEVLEVSAEGLRAVAVYREP
jgi:hypothetical protein